MLIGNAIGSGGFGLTVFYNFVTTKLSGHQNGVVVGECSVMLLGVLGG
jgi:hypothetical protein